MKSFASWLVSEGITTEDAGAHVSSPRVDKYLPKAITPDDVERLLEEPTRNSVAKPDSVRDRAMLEILYATGMRVSELVALADSLLDAFVWIKRPGESDGTCNGGPPAGSWWPEYALGLAQRANR